jgi:RNA polymerase sigma-70 factor (ECF subfamily)
MMTPTVRSAARKRSPSARMLLATGTVPPCSAACCANRGLDFVHARQRAVPGSGDSAVWAALDTAAARDDLGARLEEASDREVLAVAAERVRARVEPHTWEAFRLTGLEGRSGTETAAALGMQVGTVFKAKSKVLKMLRQEVADLEAGP